MPRRHPDETGYQVHWFVTAGLLGLASWLVIAAIVAAVIGSWSWALGLVLGAVALVGVLWAAMRAARVRTRRLTADPDPRYTVSDSAQPARRGRKVA